MFILCFIGGKFTRPDNFNFIFVANKSKYRKSQIAILLLRKAIQLFYSKEKILQLLWWQQLMVFLYNLQLKVWDEIN
jgi:hypothetical protein